MRPSNDKEAITLILQGIVNAGGTLVDVADDTWNPDERTAVSTVSEAVELVTGVDEAWVFVEKPEGGGLGWLFFVLGNEPEEVLNNHTVNLSELVDPITDPWWN